VDVVKLHSITVVYFREMRIFDQCNKALDPALSEPIGMRAIGLGWDGDICPLVGLRQAAAPLEVGRKSHCKALKLLISRREMAAPEARFGDAGGCSR
jgi:hypothetical protein